MSADRTLMSVVRTSLSLISFGFTIFQFFSKLVAVNLETKTSAVRHFAVALVLLGIAMLVFGIGFHLAFMNGNICRCGCYAQIISAIQKAADTAAAAGVAK